MQAGGRYNPYPSSQSSTTRGSALQVHQNNVPTSAYLNVPGGYDCYNGLYGPGITRANYPAYPVNYEDEIYSGQSPAYMLPSNNDSMLSTSIFGPPASPRNWDIFSNSGRGQNGLYTDQNPPGTVSLPNGNFAGSSISFVSNPNDIAPSLSSSGAMANSMTSLDRILPNPAMGRSQQSALMIAGANSLDGLAMSNIGYRSSGPWVGSDGMSGSSQSSDRVLSVSYGSTIDSNGGSSDASATSQDAPFAYGSLSHGSLGTSMKVAANTLPDLGRSELRKPSDDTRRQSRTRTLSHESTPSPENPLAEAYGYSGDIVVGRRSARGSISSGTLSNGQAYTRLRPLPTPTSELYRNSHQESAEYQSQISHRTSIASMSSSAKY